MGYPLALALTLTIEVPLYLALGVLTGRKVEGTGLRTAVVVNLVSHPLLWFVMFPVARFALGATGGLLVSEAMVVLIEAAGLRLLLDEPWPDALPRATVANAASLAAGLVLYATVFAA